MASVSLSYSRQSASAAAASLDVFTLFTGIRPTLAALRTAGHHVVRTSVRKEFPHA